MPLKKIGLPAAGQVLYSPVLRQCGDGIVCRMDTRGEVGADPGIATDRAVAK